MDKRNVVLVSLAVIAIIVGKASAVLQGYTASYSYLSRDSIVYYTDFETGQQIPIGDPSGAWIYELEYSEVDGNLYAVVTSDDFYRIDLTSGQAILLKENIFLGRTGGLSFAPDGTLFAMTNVGEMYRVNPVNGDSECLGVFDWAIGTDAFAISPEGKFIMWSYDGDFLIEYDFITHSHTLIGHLEGNFSSFDYGLDGILYGWDDLHSLYSIDVENLKATHLRSFQIESNALTIIPEPATILLLTLGAAMARKKFLKQLYLARR